MGEVEKCPIERCGKGRGRCNGAQGQTGCVCVSAGSFCATANPSGTLIAASQGRSSQINTITVISGVNVCLKGSQHRECRKTTERKEEPGLE